MFAGWCTSVHLFVCGCRGVCGVLCVGVGCVCVALVRSFARLLVLQFGGMFSSPIRRHAFVSSFRNKLLSSRKKKKIEVPNPTKSIP